MFSVVFFLLQGLTILSLAQASSSDLSVPAPPPASFWRLDSRNALVTGGTKGIGAAIVTQLSSLGCVSSELQSTLTVTDTLLLLHSISINPSLNVYLSSFVERIDLCT
jgi:hypothetical protein